MREGFVVVVVCFVLRSWSRGSSCYGYFLLFLSLVFKIESFLVVEEAGIAADEGGGDQYFAVGAFEGGMIDFRLRVKHFPAVFDKLVNAIEITVIMEIYFFEIELLWLHLISIWRTNNFYKSCVCNKGTKKEGKGYC